MLCAARQPVQQTSGAAGVARIGARQGDISSLRVSLRSLRLIARSLTLGHTSRLSAMTTLQLHLFNCIYLAISVIVAILTRATARRLFGALAGAAVGGLLAISGIALGERLLWWHMSITWAPWYLILLWIDFTVCAYVFLILWRIVRRFGWRGLAVVILATSVIGPLRDYWYMKRFPEWGAYGPGVTPFVVIAAGYPILIVVGYAVMRIIAGPARGDRLARPLWKVA
jgi:hypothetical protein